MKHITILSLIFFLLLQQNITKCSFLSLFSDRRLLHTAYLQPANNLEKVASAGKKLEASGGKENPPANSGSMLEDTFFLPNIEIDKVKVKNKLSQIVIDDMKRYQYFINNHNLDFESACQLKQGHLNLVSKINEVPKDDRIQVHVEPIFVVINTETLSVFEVDQVETLKDAVKLQNIKKVSEEPSFTGSYCFNLEIGLNVKLNDNPEGIKTSASHYFCTETKELMKAWVKTLNEFFYCNKKPQPDADPKQKEKEELIKKLGKLNEIKREFESRQRMLEAEEDNIIQNEEKELGKDLAEDIIEHLKMAEESERQKKIKKEEVLGRLQRKLDKLIYQRKCLEEGLREKELLERAATENLIKEEKRKILKEKIFQAVNQIDALKKDEEAEVIGTEDKLLEEVQQKIETEAETIAKLALETQKLLDYRKCYDDRVKDKNEQFRSKYISKTCEEVYLTSKTFGISSEDAQKLSICSNEVLFCKLCCDGLIGTGHILERKKCFSLCKSKQEQLLNTSISKPNTNQAECPSPSPPPQPKREAPQNDNERKDPKEVSKKMPVKKEDTEKKKEIPREKVQPG